LIPTKVIPPAAFPSRQNGVPDAPPVWQSRDLFQGCQEVIIQHDGQDYRLRITQQNKLILTK
jgi:hemin uptake protein HemP